MGALVCILLLSTRIPEQRKKEPALTVLPKFLKTFDLLGFVLFAPAAIMCLMALEYGGKQYPWSNSRVIGLFVGSGVTILVFLAWEYKMGKEAMIPLHLLRPRIAYASYIVMAMVFGLTMIVAYYQPIYFQAVRGESPLTSGVDLLPMILSQLVMAVASGVLSVFSNSLFIFSSLLGRFQCANVCVCLAAGKLGYYLPWALVGAALCTIGAGLLGTLSPTSSTAAWAGFQVILGIGRGASTQPVSLEPPVSQSQSPNLE